MPYEYLAHHGIKGMKWGVRRYQNPDGSLTPEGRQRYGRDLGSHTISKGTTVYRATVNPGETKDYMYVTYTNADRALYKGSYGQSSLTSQQGGQKLYETSYKLTKDLKVPSRDLVQQIINEEMTNDPKFRNQASEAQAGAWFMKQWFSESYGSSDEASYMYDKYSRGEMSYEEYEKDFNKHVFDMGKEWAKKHVSQYSSMSVNEVFAEGAQSFGTSQYNKTKIANRLKALGYNAMVDEAGVGFNTTKEGIEPLIVFDSDSFEVMSSSYVSPSTSKKYDEEYRKWQRTSR